MTSIIISVIGTHFWFISGTLVLLMGLCTLDKKLGKPGSKYLSSKCVILCVCLQETGWLKWMERACWARHTRRSLHWFRTGELSQVKQHLFKSTLLHELIQMRSSTAPNLSWEVNADQDVLIYNIVWIELVQNATKRFHMSVVHF